MNAHDIDIAMRELAEIQHGVVSREQARELGATREMLRGRVRRGTWESLTPKVLRLVGTAETHHQRCMAAVLDASPEAAVSHRSAAALWRLPGFSQGPVEVTRLHHDRTTRASGLAKVHRTCSLPDHHCTLVDGIPVTTVARTIFDLAGVLHMGRVARALDNALARKLTAVRSLRAITEELAARGRPGSAVMRELMRERGHTYVAPDSGLEARFLAILRDAGVPLPVPQRDVGGDRWVGRVDYRDVEFPLVYEIDSSLHHSTQLDRAADARRDEELRKAGFGVCRISEADVWHRPDAVLARVLAARRRAAAAA